MRRIPCLLAALLLAAATASPAEEGSFRVGAASGPSTRALVVSDGSETIAIVELEGPAPYRDLWKHALARLPEESRIRSTGLVIVRGPGRHEPREAPELAAEVARVVRSAEEALAPAELRFGRHTLRGVGELLEAPAGPVDESIAVLRANRIGGERIADLLCLSIHLPAGGRAAVRRALGERAGEKPVLLALTTWPGPGRFRLPDPGRAVGARAELALESGAELRGRLECRSGSAELSSATGQGFYPGVVKARRIRIGALTLLACPAFPTPGTGIRIRAEAEKAAGHPAVLLHVVSPTAGVIADGPEWARSWSFHGPDAPAALARALGVPWPEPTPEVARARRAGIVLGRRDRERLARRGRKLTEQALREPQPHLRTLAVRSGTRRLRDTGIAALCGVAEGAGLPLDEILLLHAAGGLPGIAPLIEPAPAEVVSRAGPNGVRVERSVVASPLPSGDVRNDRIPLEHFVPEGRSRGAIVVLPMWKGGALLAERLVAGHLAARGYRAVIMPLPWQFGRCPPGVRSGSLTVSADLERTEAALIQAHADVREVVTRLRARDDVQAGRVGVLGISLGAFVAAASYRDDPRLAAAVLVMAGGDPASVAWENGGMRRRLEQQGFTLATLRERFGILDPAASRAAPAHPGFSRYRGVLMLNALNDRIVPKANAEILWRAFGEPAIEWYPEGHYSMALRFGELMARMDRHLDPLFPVNSRRPPRNR